MRHRVAAFFRTPGGQSARALIAIGMILVGVHLTYACLTQSLPSSDEAHYMSGVLSIGRALSVSPSAFWPAFVGALGFKAPLVCVPGALFMPFTAEPVLAARLSLVLTFAVLLLVAYIYFLRMMKPLWALVATTVLVTSPVVTGLTHRFYTELLLLVLALAYMDAIVRAAASMQRRHWLYAGILAGLGVLCKSTFAPLLAAPTAWILWQALAEAVPNHRLKSLLSSVAVFLCSGVAVAASWYSRNWSAAIQHIHNAAVCPTCAYGAFPSLLAAGSAVPAVWASVLATVGSVVLIKRRMAPRSSNYDPRWPPTLLLGGFTFLFFIVGVNKSVRGLVTILPAVAVLAACGLEWFATRAGRPRLFAALCVTIGLFTATHISFGLPFIPAIRAGDLHILDSRYPLNPPAWFDDNHPLDRRHVPLDDVEQFIATDWLSSPLRGSSPTIAVTYQGLSVTFDYLALLAATRGHALRFLPTYAAAPEAQVIDYVVSCDNCEQLDPGLHNLNSFPPLYEKLTRSGNAYDEVFSAPGPSGVLLRVMRRKWLSSLAGIRTDAKVVVEAEDYSRGDVVIDRGALGYGQGIGVIVTPRGAGFAEYVFAADARRRYQFEIRCASIESRPLHIVIDDHEIPERGCSAPTGGFGPENQIWQPAARLELGAGRHTFRLERNGPFPHIDKLMWATPP